MRQPLVSVLVPSYNHAKYLVDRIESICNQTYKFFEVVVIDDVSTDDSDPVLSELQAKYDFRYIKNTKNSGTPFSAWQRIAELAKGEYIWICESDDVAEPGFLEVAVNRLIRNPNAVIFYSNSYVIDSEGRVIGNTDTYFKENWKTNRWESDFTANGLDELCQFQLYGQTIPNMSSAVIKANIFRSAFNSHLKKFKLTGDWLFAGEVMRFGDVEFCQQALSRFRKHEETSRVRVKSARSQAEFILTKYNLFVISGHKVKDFARIMQNDMIRFLYDSASFLDVIREALKISFFQTIRSGVMLFFSAICNPNYLKEFIKRYKHSKCWRKENE
jgi:glycosyltransferase involved in cell wall biosynthesis